MEPMKLDVLFAFFAYGGNGGIAMQLPEITTWYARLGLEMKQDPRIGRIASQRFGDVPLTMERNRAVKMAKDLKMDVLVMIDSDNVPDLYLDKIPEAKSFFWSSFDFLHERKMQGLPTVVTAPYCGPPPHPTRGGMENIYMFYVEDYETDILEAGYQFCQYSRAHAASMTGIQPLAAGPTGCIMYSVDAFDLMPVRKTTQGDILDAWKSGAISKERALLLLKMQSWFFYEYTDMEQTKKASTEDVTNTREIQFAGCAKFNKPVLFGNWDAWAGHYKPKCVGKPSPVTVNEINPLYQEAVARQLEDQGSELRSIDFSANLEIPCEDNGRNKGNATEVNFLKVDEDAMGDAHDILSEIGDSEGDVVAAKPTLQSLGAGTLSSPNFNIEIFPRMIGGRKVLSVGHSTDDGSLKALEILVQSLAYRKPDSPLRIVEVGSWVGESALTMHAALGKAGGTIYCVDTWEGSHTDRSGLVARSIGGERLFQYFKDNVGDLLDHDIKVIRNDSVIAANSFKDPQEADLIFLDAAHDYDDCKADIEAWFRHVADDGVLCGHDFGNGFPGVDKAVKEFTDSAGICVQILDGSVVWFFTKADYYKGKEARRLKEERRMRHREGIVDEGNVTQGEAVNVS